jgi:RimJ/RimL family protein N-acetyltransferase
VTVRPLHPDDLGLVERLVGGYPFKAYRQHRVLSRARQRAVLTAEIARSRDTPGSLGLAVGDGEAAAIAFARPLDWDSRFFGVSMARVDYLLRGAQATRAALSEIVAALLAACRAQGIQHVTAKVDVADLDAVAALEGSGFRLMDALVTYFTHPHRKPPNEVREVGTVRPFRPDDADELLDITRTAYQRFRGRFHLDPHLPQERSDELYVEWARQCMAGRMADRIVVADDGRGGMHGWASTRRVEPASSAGGIAVFAGSLGACRPDRPGAYAGLIRALAWENYQAGAVTETQTQNHNVATVRIYEAVGAQYVRGDYTFHAWV